MERWKRGLWLLAFIGLFVVGAGLLAALTEAALEFLGAGETAQVVVGLVVFATVAPWYLGDRQYLRTLGRFADVADERDDRA
ncbi:hypothetical protein D2V07_16640 [Aurantiacibacter zhengii]|uniref:Uncharacterized protein n=1 Tax=Aurantiacibacter zhengii TaxID=2307003 RepID=A0A418NNJ0_9SPHN|nr:hypothetical protein D2V07_16640 [Aurantiacibacter zhengii]